MTSNRVFHADSGIQWRLSLPSPSSKTVIPDAFLQSIDCIVEKDSMLVNLRTIHPEMMAGPGVPYIYGKIQSIFEPHPSLKHGESILAPVIVSPSGKKGWCLVKAGPFSIGWGKGDGTRLKNHYPKGLRRADKG